MRIAPTSISLPSLLPGLLAAALFLTGCDRDADAKMARAWCGFTGDAETPFLRAGGFQIAPGIATADANDGVEDAIADAVAESDRTAAPKIKFVDTTIATIRFHRDGTLDVTDRSGAKWQASYEFVGPYEIAYQGPDEREIREGVALDGNTLALVRLKDNNTHEVRRFVRALPFIPC